MHVRLHVGVHACVCIYSRVIRLCIVCGVMYGTVQQCYGEFKSLRLRPPTPEAYDKTADFGTLCITGSSQRLDPSAALLSASDRSRLAALDVMLTPCPVP